MLSIIALKSKQKLEHFDNLPYPLRLSTRTNKLQYLMQKWRYLRAISHTNKHVTIQNTF